MKAVIAGCAGAALLVIGALTTSRPARAVTLTPGTYNVSGFVTSFTSSGNFCFSYVKNDWGYVLSFYMTYNGAGKAAAATIQVPFNPNPTPGPYMVFLSLPPTPTGTNPKWAGKYTEKLLPAGGNFSPQAFNATLKVTSALSFLGTMTLDAFSDGPNQSCTISFQYAAVFVGPVN